MNKQEFAKQEIVNWIQSGRYAHGSKLDPILKIAENLNLKSQPVRKALGALVDEGLLYTVNGKGVFVRRKEDPASHIMILFDRVESLYASSQKELGWFLNLEVYQGIQSGIKELEGVAEDRCFASDYNTPADFVRRIDKDQLKGIITFDVEQSSLVDQLTRRVALHRVVSVAYSGFPTPFNEVKPRIEPGIHAILEKALEYGHRKFAFLYGRNVSTQWTHMERYRSVISFFQKNGLSVDPLCMVATGGSSMDGYRATRQILDRVSDVTAIFCATDDRARGALQAIEDKGLRVGVDVSVIGFDDMPEAESLGLATVRTPRTEIGHEAVRLLERCAREKLCQQRLWIDTKPIYRKSLGPVCGK